MCAKGRAEHHGPEIARCDVVIGAAMTRRTLEPSAAGAGTRRRVLIVDDEPVLRQLLSYLLRKHELVMADDGETALEVLAGDDRFDVILTDLSMPAIGGLELHRRVSERHPHLARRIIFCSGNPDDRTLLAFLGTVPNLMVPKPYKGSTIEAAIEATVNAAAAEPAG
jgi:CheY-like chemotaxis protein